MINPNTDDCFLYLLHFFSDMYILCSVICCAMDMCLITPAKPIPGHPCQRNILDFIYKMLIRAVYKNVSRTMRVGSDVFATMPTCGGQRPGGFASKTVV